MAIWRRSEHGQRGPPAITSSFRMRMVARYLAEKRVECPGLVSCQHIELDDVRRVSAKVAVAYPRWPNAKIDQCLGSLTCLEKVGIALRIACLEPFKLIAGRLVCKTFDLNR